MNCPVCRGELQGSSSFCPYCGTRLDWTGSTRAEKPPAKAIGAAVRLIVLVVAGSLFAAGMLTPVVTRLYDDARSVIRDLTCLSPTLCTNSTFPTTPGNATYDQQVSLIFTQDFQALSYNVTAVPQTDTSGFGPAYLLNGLSDAGYWYQVGLAYNWPLASGNGYDSGFHFIWEVFTPTGATSNPVLSRVPDNVNSGDVGLSLSFQTGTGMVVMYAKDYNTGASSSHSYTAGGGTIFKGSSSSRATRMPTSLMTEWYHPSSSETAMKQVIYSENGLGIQSAWICIGEYVPPNPSSLVYSQCTGLALTLTSQLQGYSYHGLNAYASQSEFQTGPS